MQIKNSMAAFFDNSKTMWMQQNVGVDNAQGML